jgi:hypothetical protein
VTTDELSTFRRAAIVLEVPASLWEPLELQLLRAQMLGAVRNGAMPRVEAAELHLLPDEHCYLLMTATRWRVSRQGWTPRQAN